MESMIVPSRSNRKVLRGIADKLAPGLHHGTACGAWSISLWHVLIATKLYRGI